MDGIMKQITNKTILKQGDKTYQPIEIDGVIYWVDDKEELISENDYSVMHRLSDNKPYINSASHYKANKKEKGKIIAQSQPKLDGIPVVSLVSYVDKQKNDSWTVVSSMFPKLIFTLFSRIFKDGYESNPNQYTQADIEKVYYLAKRLGDDFSENYTIEELLKEINSISVIEVDEKFNVIGYE